MRAYLFLLLLVACRPRVYEIPTTPNPNPMRRSSAFGLTKEGAIEVCYPGGEVDYLERLRCSDGSILSYHRQGNVGERNPPNMTRSPREQRDPMRVLELGEIDAHVVDAYEVVCSDLKVNLYLDMYHCAYAPPSIAPAGFTLLTPQKK